MEDCEIYDNLSPLVANWFRQIKYISAILLEGHLVTISAKSISILMIGFREDVKVFKRGT